MLTRLDLRGKLDGTSSERSRQLRRDLPRPSMATEPPVDAVRAILAEVKSGGDEALRRLTARFDQIEIDEIRVPAAEMEAALRDLSPLLREALEEAYDAILAFHRSTKPEDGRFERDG